MDSHGKPRILYVLHNPFIRCGTEIHTRALFDGLADRYDTWVVFPRGDRLFLSQDGEQATTWPADSPQGPVTPYAADTTDRSMQRILDRINPDLIHIQHFMKWPLGIIDLLVASRIPVVLSLHDRYAITPSLGPPVEERADATLSPEYAVSAFGQDISAYLRQRRQILQASLETVSAIVVPSQYLAGVMSAVFRADYRTIAHGVERINLLSGGRDKTRFVFGFVGHLIPVKGWEMLARAFPEIKRQYPHAELHFYGSPLPGEPSGSGIYYHGRYEQQDLAGIFAAIDVVVIPSTVPESYCLVLSEAWAAARPVVVSDTGALGERVTDGVNGKKFCVNDSRSLQQSLLWFLQHDDWRGWKIPAPRGRAEMIEDYDRLYREFLP